MSRWSEEFEIHPIHNLIGEIKRFLSVKVDTADANLEDELRRLKNVLLNLDRVVKGLDPEFFPKQLLDQIYQHLNHPHFRDILIAYFDSPDKSLLQTANDHISQYTIQIFQLASMSRPLETREYISNAQESFNSFSRNLESVSQKIREDTSKQDLELSRLVEKSSTLENKLEELQRTANERMVAWESEFSQGQNNRNEEHSAAQISREEKFEETFNHWKLHAEQNIIEVEGRQKEQLEGVFDRLSTYGNSILEDAKEKHAEIIEIHQLVGRDSVAGGYQASAGEEKEQADFWRIASLICVAATVIWLIVKYSIGFTPNPDGGFNWADLITATSLTAILIYAASYTSRQSKMHRENEKMLRSYALETKALDPFISSLEKHQQQAIKAELVARMFGQQNSIKRHQFEKIDESTANTIAEKAVEGIFKIINKTKGVDD